MTEEQLSALLRLKRFEQPPAGYYDQLVKDIHRRQRAEILQQPLWRIAFERMQTFFGEHSMGSLSYTGAMAGFLLVGLATIGLMTPADQQPAPPKLAAAPPKPQPDPARFALEPSSEPAFTVAAPALQGIPPQLGRREQLPRYVIDARPASYEPSFNF